MRICQKCGKVIPIKPGRKKNICLPCHKQYTKAHYENNKRYYVDKARRYSDKMREFIRQHKEVPCADCKIQYPYYVMDFDHLYDKRFTISRKFDGSKTRLMKEIKKCDVVCANCHRERTQKRIKKSPRSSTG